MIDYSGPYEVQATPVFYKPNAVAPTKHSSVPKEGLESSKIQLRRCARADILLFPAVARSSKHSAACPGSSEQEPTMNTYVHV